MASPASLYEVLGISRTASFSEVKIAYRKLARTCHPDVVTMNQKGHSGDEFINLHAAYSTLSDPEKRAQYDRETCRHGGSFVYSSLTSPYGNSVSGYHRRNAQSAHKWETDQCW